VRAPARALFAAGLTLSALGLASCGGRFVSPHGAAARTTVIGGSGRTVGDGGDSTTPSTSSAQSSARASDPSALPTLPSTGSHPTTVPTTTRAGSTASGDPTQRAITSDYEAYLVDLSGLDDNLSKAYVGPLASVTTNRLAQASVRQAATLLAAQEHGVGTLRDDHVSVVMTGPASAALADCQDEDHFYLVDDNSGTPDPFIERGYFVGSAQMVLQNGHWLVDVFTTTHDTCAAF
jgi:hypothetical protein